LRTFIPPRNGPIWALSDADCSQSKTCEGVLRQD
jgi:hypothetical protein